MKVIVTKKIVFYKNEDNRGIFISMMFQSTEMRTVAVNYVLVNSVGMKYENNRIAVRYQLKKLTEKTSKIV